MTRPKTRTRRRSKNPTSIVGPRHENGPPYTLEARKIIAQIANTEGNKKIAKAIPLTASTPRATLAKWLEANDPNGGPYSDRDAKKHGQPLLSLDEAWLLVASSLDFTTWEEDGSGNMIVDTYPASADPRYPHDAEPRPDLTPKGEPRRNPSKKTAKKTRPKPAECVFINGTGYPIGTPTDDAQAEAALRRAGLRAVTISRQRDKQWIGTDFEFVRS